MIRPHTTTRAALAAAAFHACMTPAFAVMAPEVYAEGRSTAPNHVQIEVTDVEGPGGGMGSCPVEGKVVQVFKGDLQTGQELSFTVSCYDYGEIPAGGTLWTDYEALKHARFLEAFMTQGPEPAIVLDQVEIIVAPRGRPFCASDSLQCESTIEAVPIEEPCGFFEEIWSFIGLGDRACD